MFEWTREWQQVAEGATSPLMLVGALEALDDQAMLALDADDALAVVELTQAAMTALGAVQALAVEAYTRREEEGVARFRDDARQRGSSSLGVPTGDDLAASTLATIFHVAPRTMGAQLDETRRLVNALPGVFGLVRGGRLDVHRARVVSSEGALVSFDKLGDFDEAMVHPVNPRYRLPMTDLSVAALRKRAASTAVAVDPESARARAEAALADRYVRVSPGVEPGMSSWSASLPAEVSVRVWAAVDALAAEYLTAKPELRVAQARADALGDLVLANASITTTVDLVVPLPDLPGLSPSSALPAPSALPGRPSQRRPAVRPTRKLTRIPLSSNSPFERHLHLVTLEGVDVEIEPGGHLLPDAAPPDRVDVTHHPVDVTHPVDATHHPVDAAHHPVGVIGVPHHPVGIILNSAVTALLSDPDTRIRLHGSDVHTGALVVHDPTIYRPNQRLRRIVRARDGHCRFPGCGVEARRCQLDHVVPFPEGLTTLDNLHSLCATHHAFKHHSGWTVTMDPSGECTWTTPQGRTILTVPEHTLGKAA